MSDVISVLHIWLLLSASEAGLVVRLPSDYACEQRAGIIVLEYVQSIGTIAKKQLARKWTLDEVTIAASWRTRCRRWITSFERPI